MFKQVLIGIAAASALAAGMLALPDTASADTPGFAFHSGRAYPSIARIWLGDYGKRHHYHGRWHDDRALRGRAERRPDFRRREGFRRDHRWGDAYRRGDDRHWHGHVEHRRDEHAYHRPERETDRR